MLFWIAILTGALFIWLAVRMGFYEMWALLFNLIVSIYVSIFLAPLMAESVPMPGKASWCMALSMIVLAGGCFALLHGLSWVFLTGQFKVQFPNLFDVVLSGALGFVAGFLILSFAALTLSTTPVVQRKIVSTLGLGREAQQANIAGVAYCCDFIHGLVGFGDTHTTRTAVTRLFETTDRLSASDEPRVDPNEPNAIASPKPNEPEAAKPKGGLHRRSISDSMD
ncbi:MAG TPA: CvpA family protein [Sedimentisphaerales bacterium]|jgi:hypothetical protein|nr:CvpA family protein [Sedimentisphaerales bacterium]HNU31575.1 CvpA family protein [Sedimentisphaerales bacterium]